MDCPILSLGPDPVRFPRQQDRWVAFIDEEHASYKDYCEDYAGGLIQQALATNAAHHFELNKHIQSTATPSSAGSQLAHHQQSAPQAGRL